MIRKAAPTPVVQSYLVTLTHLDHPRYPYSPGEEGKFDGLV